MAALLKSTYQVQYKSTGTPLTLDNISKLNPAYQILGKIALAKSIKANILEYTKDDNTSYFISPEDLKKIDDALFT